MTKLRNQKRNLVSCLLMNEEMPEKAKVWRPETENEWNPADASVATVAAHLETSSQRGRRFIRGKC